MTSPGKFRRAVIMAGGEGTRLHPYTHVIPKPLLPLGRKPIVQHIVERLKDNGFPDITMCVGYAAEMIMAYFQNGSQFGVNIDYYREPTRLGTAGALVHITERLADHPFLLTNGDVITDLDYDDFYNTHLKCNHWITVAVRADTFTVPYGVLELNDGAVLSVKEKPSFHFHINAGIYIIEPKALQYIEPGKPFDMTDLIFKIIELGYPVGYYEITGKWHDLAQTSDLERALKDMESSLLPE